MHSNNDDEEETCSGEEGLKEDERSGRNSGASKVGNLQRTTTLRRSRRV